MAVDRVRFQDVVASQLPRYVREDFPLLGEFLEQYYVSQETQGGTYDLIQNLDQYVKVEELTNLKTETILSSDISFTDSVISTTNDNNFTDGFPERNGLIQIDNEIISYEYTNTTQFVNCTRGFSGITSYISSTVPDELVFESSVPQKHKKGAVIKNLNVIFLQLFFRKLKEQIAPGFAERDLFTGLNKRNFIYQAKDFYTSKGTDESFKILFRALFGEEVEVIKPSRFLLRPSNADYSVTQDFVVEQLQGDPEDLLNLTLFQPHTNARGTIAKVEKVNYPDKNYYQVSIDYGYQRDIDVSGTIFGNFEPNPITQILNQVSVGSTMIDVDSTVAFPETGNVIVSDIDNNLVSIAYTGKTNNQFLNVSGVTNTLADGQDIRMDQYSYGYTGINTSDTEVRVRVTSTLTGLEVDGKNYYYKKGDKINIQSLGINPDDEKSKNWLINVKTCWDVSNITLIDLTERKYTIDFYDNQLLKPGYKFVLNNKTKTVSVEGLIEAVNSATQVRVKLDSNITISDSYDLKNLALKGESTKYNDFTQYFANVQNTYSNFKNDVLVASNSIPYYNNVPLQAYNKEVTFSGTFDNDTELQIVSSGDHGFYTGDPIQYTPSIITSLSTDADGNTITTITENSFTGIDKYVFFAQRVNATTIKLAKSKSDLFSDKFVSFSGSVTNNKFAYFEYAGLKPTAQMVYRSFVEPVNKSGDYLTQPGYTGMLINGTEILNYKSPNSIYYGPINSFDVTSGGTNYDVLNPPILYVTDEVGTGATGTVSVEGSLRAISIIDPGFDYTETPIIKISGGSGSGALAEPNMTSVEHIVQFNSELTAQRVSLVNHTIGFSTYHKFRDNERVIYKTNDGTAVGGLSTDSTYYVNVVDGFTVNLHKTFDDANVGVNTINFSSFGTGTQSLNSAERKQVISSVIVTENGSGYKNRKTNINNITGVTTANNQFNIKNHGYQEKEIIKYTPGSNPVSGLSSTKDYYVSVVSDDAFTLSEVGIGTTVVDFFYNNNIQTQVTTTGDGSFNYKPIVVEVQGITGVSTLAGQDFNAVLQPCFRGPIVNIDLTDNGVGYGASTIIDFNRQPFVSINGGSGAELTPVVNNGKITDVIINNGGSGYVAPPDLEIKSVTGDYAVLVPQVNEGKIVNVIINKSGAGYDKSTFIKVNAPGQDAEVFANINAWNINLFERNFNNIEDDDGFLEENISDTSLEYCHIYAPRALRENVYAISNSDSDNTLYGVPDLVKSSVGRETQSTDHSPIIGWAYDGNPIYGPYGFANPDGSGGIRRIETGYELNVALTNRPPDSLYPRGFFTNDYVFNGDKDLDVHNGRFCVTPDYPGGVYAYFASVNNIADSSGPFNKYFRPQFPFLIGNTFKSVPNQFNFDLHSNQTTYDIEGDGWFRNTTPYNLTSPRSRYDYIFNSDSVIDQTIQVKSASIGSVEGIDIVSGGDNYKVGDRLVFDNKGSSGFGAASKVSRVRGKTVEEVSLATTSYFNVEFVPNETNTAFLGITTSPHTFEETDIVSVSGLSTDFAGFYNSYRVGIRSESFVLTLGINNVATTGITTYLYVQGALNPYFVRPDDVLKIDNEQFLVLNVDQETSRIRVNRAYNGTAGVAHLSRTPIREIPRKFTIGGADILQDTKLVSNTKLYFDPSESVSIGDNIGVGIGSTVVFNDPGVGATQVFIPHRRLYFPGHGLKLNDQVTYSSNGGSPLTGWNNAGSETYTSLATHDPLYVYPYDEDFIGLSSSRVGVNTLGILTAINNAFNVFSFGAVGTGGTHFLKTNLNNVLKTTVSKNTVTVNTGVNTHGMSNKDVVFVSLRPTDTQTVIVRYNDYNRRIVFDPKDFAAGDVDTTLNTISFPSVSFQMGDRVILTAATPPGGLVNQKMYYIYPYTSTKYRLVEDKYELTKKFPSFVNITTQQAGTLSNINPAVNVEKNQNIRFDLSDTSLTFSNSGVTYPAFLMKFYTDKEFVNVFETSGKLTDFEVTRSGTVGTANAYLNLFVSDYVPNILYYQFEPINLTLITDVKRGIVKDATTNGCNEINLVNSDYSGTYNISGVGTNTFSYSIEPTPGIHTYTKSNASILYDTNSLTAYGPITKLFIQNQGTGYRNIPGITTVRTTTGSGAILDPSSTNIGKIFNTKFQQIGFDYPTDETLRPVASLPRIIQVQPLTSFESIGITSTGRNYLVAPELVVIDGFTGKVVDDVDIQYDLGDSQVTIFKNTFGLYNVTPRIVPTQNTNGIGINTLSYNSTTKDVRLFLDQTFSNASDFPFGIGDKVIVENIAVTGASSTITGYNSKGYDYTLFTLTEANGQIGGSGAFVGYNMSDVLNTGEDPGTMDLGNSFGRVVPEKQFPIFEPVLVKNEFYLGQNVTSGESVGVVDRWDKNSEFLAVTSNDTFVAGNKITGESENTQSIIETVYTFDGEITTGVGATFERGWQTNSGFLNDSLQRIPNNEYYQNFSYALSSKVQYQEWNNAVSSMNHTAGFDKYSDLQIETGLDDFENPDSGIPSTPESDIESITDIIVEGDLNCYYDWDDASERTVDVNGVDVSNLVVFKNRIISDYFQSIGNRALSIDDVSGQFNSNERNTPYESVASFAKSDIFNKVITFVQDRTYTQERQFSIVDLLQFNDVAYTNEFSSVDTITDLGYFDYLSTADGWDLVFYPVKSEFNTYDVTALSMSVGTLVGTYTTAVGTISSIKTYQENVPASGSAGILTVSTSDYRSIKVLTLFQDTSNNFEGVELNIIHDGTEVYMLEYGNIQNEEGTLTGFGTFGAAIAGGNLTLTFHSDVGVALTANSSVIGMSPSNTGIGSVVLETGTIRSSSASISASGSPTATVVDTYSDPYKSSYYFVQVADTTNNNFECFEVGTVNSTDTEGYVQYANVYTAGTLGTVGLTTVTDGVNLVFTPIPSIDCEVRVFGVQTQLVMENTLPSGIGTNNFFIKGDYGDYSGTKLDLAKSFNLQHKTKDIFRRDFDGSNAGIVDTSQNLLNIPEHFFVTGEQVKYTFPGNASRIGIGTTNVAGVGVTDLLPSDLFVIKTGEGTLRFADTAANALARTKRPLNLASVGIGTSHAIEAINQNTKAIIAIDNVVQSPLSGSAVTFTLSGTIAQNVTFEMSGISSIFANDTLKINEEYMTVESVGVGGPNFVTVRRAQFGSNLTSHSAGALVTKQSGNYNITGNTLFLADAPYGNVPLSTTSDPDEYDWTGITTRSTFQGRTFMRGAAEDTGRETYATNFVFDDVSHEFTGIKSDFILRSNGSETAGFSTNNGMVLINGIFQKPVGVVPGEGSYRFIENSGISSVHFVGSGASLGYDPNRSNLPLGGLPISLGSVGGFGYQPLVAAGGTAVVSGLGTIQSIAIGQSGSGYRPGIQTIINVGVQTYSDGTPNIEFIGTAAVTNGNIVSVAITNPGTGYTSTETIDVVFDEPLSYSNVPLIYSTSATAGSGVSATANIVVGQGSSVITFELHNQGYAYGNGEILTVDIGGTTGIPTDTTKTFSEFQLTVDRVYTDPFNSWTLGEFQALDNFTGFDGSKKVFDLELGGAPISIQARKGSPIELSQILLIFLNNTLQQPDSAYTFTGGSQVTFSQAPNPESECQVIFYKGTPEVDVAFTDVEATVKVGDTVKLNYDSERGQSRDLDQDPRVVVGINTIDSVLTNPYIGPGVTTDPSVMRPVTWCKQTVDKVINGEKIGKDREEYEPQIYPSAYITQGVGIGSTVIYIDSVRPLFDGQNENNLRNFQLFVTLQSQDVIEGATATANVSTAGTITSLTVVNAGSGYTGAPEVTIGNPVGLGSTMRASATASVSSGSVTGFTITGMGTGYSQTNPPAVLVETNEIVRETVRVGDYSGDGGVLVGIGTTISSSQPQLVFDTFIPTTSFFRNSSLVGAAVTISGISAGDYFTIYGTNVSIADTFATEHTGGGTIGIATTAVDGVYQVESVETRIENVTGIGNTSIVRIFANVDTVGIGTSVSELNSGNFSWGRIQINGVVSQAELNFYGMNGYTGIDTSGLIVRTNPLKFNNYV